MFPLSPLQLRQTLNIKKPSEKDFEGQEWNNYLDPEDNLVGDHFVLNQYDEVEARFINKAKAEKYVANNADEDFELRVEHIDDIPPDLYEDADDVKGCGMNSHKKYQANQPANPFIPCNFL